MKKNTIIAIMLFLMLLPLTKVYAYENSPFYGIWCAASKDRAEMEQFANNMRNAGYPAEVYVTTDWSNLNSEKWYVVTAGTYGTEDAAKSALPHVQEYYRDAYVKYTGYYQGGNTSSSQQQPNAYATSPFYGIWCAASKDRAEMEQFANNMRNAGYPAEVYVTTDWSNLNSEKWYVVTAGTYSTESAANNALPHVQEYYRDAYVKYSGIRIGY